MIDIASNFARGTVSAITATTVTYTKTGAQDFPNPTTLAGNYNPDVGYNVVIWDSTDYASPDLDPNVMIFRVTSWVSGTMTGYWVGQNEALVAQSTPSLISGKTYTAIFGPTAKFATDLLYTNSTTFVRIFSDMHDQNVGPFYLEQNGGTRSTADGNYFEGAIALEVAGSSDSLYIADGNIFNVVMNGSVSFSSSPLIIRARINPWSYQGTADNADFQAFVGIMQSIGGGGVPSTTNTNTNIYAIGFLIDPTGGDTNPLNIHCVTENGSSSARTSVDSGVAFGQTGPIPLSPTVFVNLEAWITSSVVYFWINGSLVATITTNIYTSPDYSPFPCAGINGTSGASGDNNQILVDYFEVIYKRPNP